MAETFCAPRYYDLPKKIIGMTGYDYCKKTYGKSATCVGGTSKCDYHAIIDEDGVVCKVTSCDGSVKNCCIDGKDSGERCDTKYSNLSSSCNSTMSKFCTGDKIFTNNRCAAWATINQTPGDALKINYCNAVDSTGVTNLTKPFCAEWCRANPGKCDAAATKFCEQLAAENTANDFCSCINNKLAKATNGVYKPACSDRNCKLKGYATAAMINDMTKCADVIDCKQFINLSPDDKTNILKSVMITQNCNVAPTISDVASNISNVSSNNLPINSGASNDTTKENMSGSANKSDEIINIVLIFILVLFLFVIIKYYGQIKNYVFYKNKTFLTK